MFLTRKNRRKLEFQPLPKWIEMAAVLDSLSSPTIRSATASSPWGIIRGRRPFFGVPTDARERWRRAPPVAWHPQCTGRRLFKFINGWSMDDQWMINGFRGQPDLLISIRWIYLYIYIYIIPQNASKSADGFSSWNHITGKPATNTWTCNFEHIRA